MVQNTFLDANKGAPPHDSTFVFDIIATLETPDQLLSANLWNV